MKLQPFPGVVKHKIMRSKKKLFFISDKKNEPKGWNKKPKGIILKMVFPTSTKVKNLCAVFYYNSPVSAKQELYLPRYLIIKGRHKYRVIRDRDIWNEIVNDIFFSDVEP